MIVALLSMNNLPNHIAFIPDGNRRWAKQKGLLASLGHNAGKDTAETIIRAVRELGVPYMSFWGCSVGNVTKRDSAEVQFLYKIFKEQFERLANDQEIHENQVKVRILGEWKKYFPADVQAAAENLIQKTAHYSKFHLTFLMAYSGVAEMIQAIQAICDMQGEKLVNKERVKKHLYTSELPVVDLVIRTGGEPHLSEGFMMWDTTDAQLYFTETLWPDFSPAELEKAVGEYGERERRLGK